MRLIFDPSQDFQLQAIEAVCGLLEGQGRVEPELVSALERGFAAVANRRDLPDEALLKNLQAVQGERGIAEDSDLACIRESIETATGPREVSFPNFSVEMETGTGKTYVYIRTALELFRRYGMRKFIAVVPSGAIRKGRGGTLRERFHFNRNWVS